MYSTFTHRSEQGDSHLARGYYQGCPNKARENYKEKQAKQEQINARDKDLQLTKIKHQLLLQIFLKWGETRGTSKNGIVVFTEGMSFHLYIEISDTEIATTGE